jgi:phage head maturation protease
MIATIPHLANPFAPPAAAPARRSAPAKSEAQQSYRDWYGASLAHLYQLGQTGSGRDAEPSEAAAHQQTATRPAAQRPAARPDLRVGRVVEYGTASTVAVFQGQRIRVRPGAFDRSLQSAAAGLAELRLLVDHDPRRELARMSEGCFSVFSAAGGLFLAMRDPALLATIDRDYAGYPELSAGQVIIGHTSGRDERGPVVDVHDSVLAEVSLVARGAFPGTFRDPIAAMRRDAAESLRWAAPCRR